MAGKLVAALNQYPARTLETALTGLALNVCGAVESAWVALFLIPPLLSLLMLVPGNGQN